MFWDTLNNIIEKSAPILGYIVLLFGALGGIVGLCRWIYQKLTYPKVKLGFVHSDTFHRRTDEYSRPTIWVHVRAENDSHSVIKNCKAYLCNAWILHSNESKEKINNFNAKLPLHWAHTYGAVNIDLLAHEHANIDIFYIDREHLALNVATNPNPAGTEKRFGHGSYIFEVVCLADNAKSDRLYLKFIHTGFENPKVEIMDNF